MRLRKQTARELATESALLAAGTIAIVLLHRNPLLLSAVLLVLAASVMALWREKNLPVYIVGAIAGPGAEVFGVRAGAWKYAAPAFLGIPLWLPFAWGYAAILVIWIAETVSCVGAE
jgi:hypothetical protein